MHCNASGKFSRRIHTFPWPQSEPMCIIRNQRDSRKRICRNPAPALQVSTLWPHSGGMPRPANEKASLSRARKQEEACSLDQTVPRLQQQWKEAIFLGSTPVAFGEADGATDSRLNTKCRHCAWRKHTSSWEEIFQIWAAGSGPGGES